jgi:hypothetical protein
MSHIDDYVQEDQQQPLWCWAAVACSMAAYRHRPEWLQCLLVQKVRDLSGCCGTPSSCNDTGSLKEALQHTMCLASHLPTRVGLSDIQGQIGSRRPVCFRIGRPDGTAHVAVMVGHDGETGDNCRLDILDPWTGAHTVEYGVLRDVGYAGGSWSDTYFVS